MTSIAPIRQKCLYPSLLILALISHTVYYINVLNGTYEQCLPLLAAAIAALTLGYLLGSVTSPNRIERPEQHRPLNAQSANRIKNIAFCFFLIGVAAHVVHYTTHPLTSYSASYGANQGSGYVTAFFIFWPLSIILNEFLITRGFGGKSLKWASRLSLILFCFTYFFLLMKRRQILFLLIALGAIWGPRLKSPAKILVYAGGAFLVLGFMVFGKIRGYYDVHGLESSITYAIANFTPEWLSLEQTEGKFISRTLDDVFRYVRTSGYDPSVLTGVATCLIPRSLLGGSKPLAFPEWYTSHFYPDNFTAGTGYAGSMAAELFLIGGLAVVIIGYAIFGVLCARIQIRGRQSDDAMGCIVYAVFVYTVFLLPRYDLASLLIDLVFTYLPLIWAVSSSLREGDPHKIPQRKMFGKQKGNAKSRQSVSATRRIAESDSIS